MPCAAATSVLEDGRDAEGRRPGCPVAGWAKPEDANASDGVPPFKPELLDERWALRQERLRPPCALRRRGVAERGNDVVDHFLDQETIVALAHHADHRFGAGGADQQRAMAVEALLALVDCRLHLV